MKIGILLAFAVIVAMLALVGCSNTSSTTGNTSDLNAPQIARLSNNAGNTGESIAAINPRDWNAFRGMYFQDKTGCIYLQLAKDDYLTLNFSHISPITIPDGTPVEVSGHFSLVPNQHCFLGPSFDVDFVTILAGSISETKGIEGGRD